MTISRLPLFLAATLLLIGSIFVSPSTYAAQSYDNCTGFIDTLPASISTQGTWCLRKDVSTGITSGNAITIATNNVTIDCNHFKIGGLAAGNTSLALGIEASNRQNAAVRHCTIRGFYKGIVLLGGAGHLVEDNRLDNNLRDGIRVTGDNNRVRRNAVYDTGGFPASDYSVGISAYADVIDNTVAGVFATAATTYPRGIEVYGNGNEVRGNQVRGIVLEGGGSVWALAVYSAGMTVAGNRVSAEASTVGRGILGSGANTFCADNTVVNFATAYHSCEAVSGNLALP